MKYIMIFFFIIICLCMCGECNDSPSNIKNTNTIYEDSISEIEHHQKRQKELESIKIIENSIEILDTKVFVEPTSTTDIGHGVTIKYKNISKKTIKYVQFNGYGTDMYGTHLGHVNSASHNRYFGVYSNESIKPGQVKTITCSYAIYNPNVYFIRICGIGISFNNKEESEYKYFNFK